MAWGSAVPEEDIGVVVVRVWSRAERGDMKEETGNKLLELSMEWIS